MEVSKNIEVIGARVNNLKNISVSIPQGKLTVITGLSGSGKSSLAFDTIYAEGQRRYMDTFSSYARGFIGNMQRPDVDKITGLSPVIAIDQKTTSKNPRSTVGTVTEIYDYLRLLYARAATAYSYLTGEKMVHYTDEQIVESIENEYKSEKILVLVPLVKARKGHYKELFERYRKKGFLYVRVDGTIQDLVFGMRLDRYKTHDIELVIDRLKVPLTPDEDYHKHLLQTVQNALTQGDGTMMIVRYDKPDDTPRFYSRNLMCPSTGIAYAEPAPHTFSFNSPQGACPHCKGLGFIQTMDIEKLVPDKKLSVADGAIKPLGKLKKGTMAWLLEALLARYDATLKTPFEQLPEQAVSEILFGTDEKLQVSTDAIQTSNFFLRYEGVVKYLEMQSEESDLQKGQKELNRYIQKTLCPECNGARLNKEALSYRIGGKNIAEISSLNINELVAFLNNLLPQHSQSDSEITDSRFLTVAEPIVKELKKRLQFMLDVGLSYLSLSRSSDSLSGGESQRIRLATQIGSQLVHVLYILDEPSIGLHQRDNERLISSLKQLRDMGNTVIVVEHDEQMMREADYIVDIGPKAGRLGGEVVFAGTPKELLEADTLTAKYLKNSQFTIHNSQFTIPSCTSVALLPPSATLTLKGCRGNNLKNIDVSIPLGCMVGITGVSGSGKSTLINQTLYPILSKHFYRSLQDPMPYDSIEGVEYLDKVIAVDQAPIGRTPRSNPATYTGVFTDIRQLFAVVPEAQIRGWKPGRFSFNTSGGRCEACAGNGYKTIQMHFLPDVFVPCESCGGQRYNRETLEVRFKGKTIADVLQMTINQAVEFFENQPVILNKIKTLQEVGLGYIKLGQSSTTLSGGESQRMKLAAELARKETGKTLYILDEPTTGLHFEDIRQLLGVLRKLVERGNTIIIIEHNLDVIRSCDYLIDLGPEGGTSGGEVVAFGTPAQVAQNPNSLTGKFINN
ncbi:MAG: excinuclease ABC subunit UvrA [Paludibacteraceae bacterium]|nr:excinuclease ABC subunit UvrA [Paludibacteraceae bacterium]